MNYYFNREFVKASDSFQRVLDINGADTITQHFLKKSKKLMREDLPQGWSAVEMMVNK